MKRILALLAAVCLLALPLAGCGESERGSDGADAGYGDGTTAQTSLHRGTQDAAEKRSTVHRNTNASANARLRGNSRSVTGTVANPDTGSSRLLGTDEEYDERAAETRYRLMLDNARVRDTDGFLFDGENAHHAT